MKQIKLIIFDMDGLLYDTELPSFKALKRTAEKAGFNFTMEIYKKMIGVTKTVSNKILYDIYGDEFFEKQVLENYHEEFHKILEYEGINVKKGALELLDVLDEKGIKKCIASSSSRETIHYYLSMTGLTDRFDFYVSGQEVENGKPSPDIFLEACRRAGENSKAALVLEDSYNGLKAAVSANIPCVIVPDLIEPNEEMKRNAYLIVSDLGEIAKTIKNS